MSDAVGVDASLAVKWLIDEDYSMQARSLLRDAAAAESPLLVPPHFHSEVLNALYRRTRRTNNVPVPEDEAAEAVATFLSLPFQVSVPAGLYQQAYDLAASLRLGSVYDSVYVTLAQMEGVDFWTADERLLSSARGRAPWVRWIGDYPAGDQR